MFRLLSSGGESAFEGDVEGVECGFPPGDPAFLSGAGGVEAHDRHVDAFQGCLLVGEVPASSDGAADAGVDRLDRVGRAHHRPDLGVEEPVAESASRSITVLLTMFGDMVFRSNEARTAAQAAVVARWIFMRLNAVAARYSSLVTLSRPRREKRSSIFSRLPMPGSTVAPRRL